MHARSPPGKLLVAVPQHPAQIEELPWKPAIAGMVGFFLGPMPAALVTYGNLRRLRSAAKGRNVALATAIAFLGLVVLIREYPDHYLMYIVAHVVCPLLFPFLQKKEFAAWKAAHLEEPASGWHATKWAVAGLALLFPLLVASLFIFPERVQNISVRVVMPEVVTIGQPFEMKLQIRNSADKEQVLRSVIVPWELIYRFGGLRSEPPIWKDAPAATGGRYVYRLPIAANGVTELKFSGIAKREGEVSADIKVCMRTDSNCVAHRIRTRIGYTSKTR